MSELTSAIRAVCEEKGLEYESVLNTIELSLAAAYRKDYGHKNQNIKVDFDPETGKTEIMDVKIVVEDVPEEELGVEDGQPEVEVKDTKKETKPEDISLEEVEKRFNPKTDIQLSDAKLIKEDAEIGDEIKINLEVPDSYGRMAAQTAKQVIIQKLRESEREMIFNEFKEKEQEVVNGIIQRREGRNVLVDLGKAIGFLPAEEQIPGERYNTGDRIKVYIKQVELQAKGARIILSRISKEIVKTLFYLEIPELNSGMIEIKAIAREAGSRSKVAVWTDSDNIDPIGSCVGQKGSRIQTIIGELGGERIDIIEYDEDPVKFVFNSLSPAKALHTEIDEKKGMAYVKVAPDQFSLAIGRRGENIRLASALTGWKINVYEEEEGMSQESSPEEAEELVEESKVETGVEEVKADKKEKDETSQAEEKTKTEKVEKVEKTKEKQVKKETKTKAKTKTETKKDNKK